MDGKKSILAFDSGVLKLCLSVIPRLLAKAFFSFGGLASGCRPVGISSVARHDIIGSNLALAFESNCARRLSVPGLLVASSSA